MNASVQETDPQRIDRRTVRKSDCLLRRSFDNVKCSFCTEASTCNRELHPFTEVSVQQGKSTHVEV
jgi:hypothetical protein